MPEASCSLELSEWLLTKHRNSEEMEEDMASASSRNTSSPCVLTVHDNGIKTILKVFDYLVCDTYEIQWNFRDFWYFYLIRSI